MKLKTVEEEELRVCTQRLGQLGDSESGRFIPKMCLRAVFLHCQLLVERLRRRLFSGL